MIHWIADIGTCHFSHAGEYWLSLHRCHLWFENPSSHKKKQDIIFRCNPTRINILFSDLLTTCQPFAIMIIVVYNMSIIGSGKIASFSVISHKSCQKTTCLTIPMTTFPSNIFLNTLILYNENMKLARKISLVLIFFGHFCKRKIG
jgi:hypothetical protein